MATDPVRPRQPAVVVAGMHRSGTSLTASLLVDAGIHMGDMLLGPGLGNLAGHFEDLHVYDFHQRVLVANGLGSEGFTAQAEIVVPGGLVPAAERLVAHRRRHDGPWGWKDPRTTLFLDFWAEMLPEAVFLLVFRRPWEVIDSLFRRGDPSFAWNPPLAAAVWRSYNAALERFHARHPARCVVVELSQVVADPERVIARLQAAVNLPLGSPTARFRDELLVQDADSERACVLDAIDGDILDCYLRLREIAGSESPLPAAVLARGTGGRLTAAAVGEWRRAAAAEARAATVAAELDRARREIAALDAAGAEARAAADAEIARLTAAVEASRAETAVAQAVAPQLAALTEAHAAAHAEIESLIAHRDERAAALERLEGELAASMAAEEALRTAHAMQAAQLEMQAAQLESQAARLDAQAAQLESQAARLDAQAAQLETRAAKFGKQVAATLDARRRLGNVLARFRARCILPPAVARWFRRTRWRVVREVQRVGRQVRGVVSTGSRGLRRRSAAPADPGWRAAEDQAPGRPAADRLAA